VFVFASSLAVFGPPLPEVVTDETPVHPQSSYGMQKAVGELLVVDYTRKGFIDGRVARLPTVCVRPGLPNSATSSFVSGIIREPLNGKDAVCPVGTGFELWLSSPRVVVANLVRAAFLDSGLLGNQRILNVPGITVAVSEMITALRNVGGKEAVARIQFRDDPVARRVVSSWPARFDVSRALGLGFSADTDFETLVRDYVADRSRAGG
jgi:nucleoside-diphosphate-sugar epimerase